MKKKKNQHVTRRRFLKSGVMSTIGTFAIPTIVPSVVLSCKSRTSSGPAPSDMINIGAIGVGRISTVHDMPEVIKYDGARIIAVCDVDSKRVAAAKEFLKTEYEKKLGRPYDIDPAGYEDYRELLQSPGIDGVICSLPDHWHGIIGVQAVQAGKDVYLQKPASLTIDEGRKLADAVKQSGRILQMGSQQRSVDPWPQFKRACELVRNGRIGQIQTIEVGLPGDPGGGDPTPMPVPANLNYDMWLGSTPEVPYTVDRVHPQDSITARPGWLRCEQFGAGMITGWGAHHIDTAHWGMGTEYTGPIEIWGHANFPTDDPNYKGLWDVHGIFRTEALYANGVHMIVSNELPNGVKFIGSEGWIWVTRGSVGVTASDPTSGQPAMKALDASDPAILDSVIGPNEIHLYESPEQHTNWLDSIRSREEVVAPAEVGHRSCSACLLHHMAMKVDRHLKWDPEKERFINDDEANTWLSRPQRAPYTI